MKKLSFSGLILASMLSSGALPPQAATAAERPSVQTPSHGARAEVVRAARKGDVLTVELRFNATTEPFGGEIIYDHLDRGAMRVEADGQSWPLLESPEAAPEEMHLNFSYDLSKTPRVGQWKLLFAAPPAEITKASLFVQGLGVIENIPLK